VTDRKVIAATEKKQQSLQAIITNLEEDAFSSSVVFAFYIFRLLFFSFWGVIGDLPPLGAFFPSN